MIWVYLKMTYTPKWSKMVFFMGGNLNHQICGYPIFMQTHMDMCSWTVGGLKNMWHSNCMWDVAHLYMVDYEPLIDSDAPQK